MSNIGEWEEKLRIDDDGGLRSALVASASLYFIDFDAARPKLAAAYDEILRCMAGELRFYTTPSLRRYRKVDDTLPELFHRWFDDPYESPPDGGMYGVTAHSNSNPEAAGRWGLDFYVTPRSLQWTAGYLSFHLPAQAAFDGSFLELVRAVASLVPFRSGHGSLAMSRNSGYPDGRIDAAIGERCHRYSGLGFQDPVLASDYLHDHVMGAHWLTLLDDELCVRCGGVDALGATEAGIDVERLGEGVLLRAGDTPVLGDVQAGQDMSAYRSLAAFLAPVRVEPGKFVFPGLDRFEAWLTRFEPG